MTRPAVAFDALPLTEPVDRAAARAFARDLRAQGRVPGTSGAAVAVVLAVVIGAVFLFFFGGIVTSIVGSMLSSGGGAGIGFLFFLVPLLFIGAAVVVIVIALVRGAGGSAERWYRLDRFARANAMSFVPSLPTPQLPGMIFGQGSSRQSSDLVRGDRPRFVEFGNYRYTTGSGKNRTTHRWGYVAVRLDVPLPHIVLDALGNNGLFGASNLPAVFGKDQRLSLEGDFDQYFSLYCPTGYERDALYLFTPDIMARFIDNAAALDVEIVDDWLFLYARRDLSTLDPATWAWLFSVVAALLDKLAQWARWRDERLAASAAPPATDAVASGIPGAVAAAPPPLLTPPPPGVAAGGRRLKRRVPVAAFVVFGIVGLWWLFGQFGGFAAVISQLFGR